MTTRKRKRGETKKDEEETNTSSESYIANPFASVKEGDFEIHAAEGVSSSNDVFFQKANESLPSPPFQMVMVAPTNTGKSTTIVNMLKRDLFGYKKYFTKIRIFSESLTTDAIWQTLTDEQLRDSFDTIDDDEIREVWEEQQESFEEDGRDAHRELWIFDDAISKLKKGSNSKPSAVMDVYMRGRHSNISVIVTSQFYKLLPTIIRKNMRYLILYNITNKDEVKALYSEVSVQPSFKDFNKLCKTAWKQKYHFLNIHLAEPDMEKRYFLNFSHRINPDTLALEPLKGQKVDNSSEALEARRNSGKEAEEPQTKKDDDSKEALKTPADDVSDVSGLDTSGDEAEDSSSEKEEEEEEEAEEEEDEESDEELSESSTEEDSDDGYNPPKKNKHKKRRLA